MPLGLFGSYKTNWDQEFHVKKGYQVSIKKPFSPSWEEDKRSISFLFLKCSKLKLMKRFDHILEISNLK